VIDCSKVDCSKWDVYYDIITERCLKYYESEERKNPWELAIDLMDIPGFPMHCPQHHYLVPAVLLTVCRQVQSATMEQLKKDLDVANERARNVLAGFCGWYGACGAAVGVGIFMSVFTNTNPCSEKTWSLTNRATAQSLLKMSEINGPRCCKRNTYIAIDSTRDFIEKHLNISLDKPEKVVCKYSERNLECKKEQCPFYLSN